MIFRKKEIFEVSGEVERFGVHDDNGPGGMTFLLVLIGDRKIYRVDNRYPPHYAPEEVQAVHPNHVTLTKAGDLVRFSVSDRDPQTGVGTQNGPRYTLRFCRAFDGAHLAKRSERGGWRIGIGPEVIAGEIDMLPTER